MSETSLEALVAFAEAVDVSTTSEQLERALPIVTRALKNIVRDEPLPDLGETEPAFGLRFDVGDQRAGGEDSDGTS